MELVVGPLYFLHYFGIFYAVIRAFKLKTPGREDDVQRRPVRRRDVRPTGLVSSKSSEQ